MGVVLSSHPLQEEEGLLEHAQQIFLEIHRHAVLRHQLVDAGHREDAEPGPLRLAAAALLHVLPSAVGNWRHRAGVELPVGGGRVGGDEGPRFLLRPEVAAKPCKMEDGCQQGGGDACGQRDPAEQVGQTLQDEAAELLTFAVQGCHGLAEQLGVLAALEQSAQQLHWQVEQTQTPVTPSASSCLESGGELHVSNNSLLSPEVGEGGGVEAMMLCLSQ